MSLTNPNTPVSQQDLQDFYNKIKPYMGLYPSSMGQKVGKGDIYSTSERLIGQWHNGKPLYQKTITGTTPNGSGAVSTGLTNIDKCFIKCGYIRANSTNNIVSLSYYNSGTDFCTVDFGDNGETFWFSHSGGRFSNQEFVIVVNYTKTTDTAISIGDENDYSTTEKIIGTWLSGEPIYQKTVDFGYLPNNTTKAVAHGISNMDRVVHYDFIWTNPSTHDFAETNGVFSTTSQDAVSAWVDRTNIIVMTHMDRSAFPAYCTIQYTKTTS